MIEDARARQHRHRRIAGLLIAAAVAAAALISGIGGGGGSVGHAGRRVSGSGPGAGASHAGTRAFPDAPSSQANGGVETDACPLAPPNRYLPARAGCVNVIRADVNGDGRPDLVIAYSVLSSRHPDWYASGTAPPEIKKQFIPLEAHLKVVLASGRSLVTRIPQARAVAIISATHVNDDPGSEVFIQTAQGAGFASAVAYGVHDDQLVAAGVTFGYTGDSASKAGFDCVSDPSPRVIQRNFELIGPSIYGWWKETNRIYAWLGPKLVLTAQHIFRRHGQPPIRQITVGRGCATGIS